MATLPTDTASLHTPSCLIQTKSRETLVHVQVSYHSTFTSTSTSTSK